MEPLGSAVGDAMRKLYALPKHPGFEFRWGTGSTNGSLNIIVPSVCARSVVTVQTNGVLKPNFGWRLPCDATVTRPDRGIRQVGPTAFTWELSPSGWDQVVGLLEPFSEVSFGTRFQWLESQRPQGIAFIISSARSW